MIRLRVKEIAQQKGMSMGQLQRRADMDMKSIRKLYHDPYSIVTTDTLAKIAKALGVSSSELIEDVPDPSPEEEN